MVTKEKRGTENSKKKDGAGTVLPKVESRRIYKEVREGEVRKARSRKEVKVITTAWCI